MAKLYVRHTVADFKKWKVAYDEHDAMRKKFGAKKSEVFTSILNPNEIIVVTEWDSKTQAKDFVEKSDIKEVMEKAGVITVPVITYAD